MSSAHKNKLKWIAIVSGIVAILPLLSFAYGVGRTMYEVNKSPVRLDKLEAWQNEVQSEFAVIRASQRELVDSMKRQEEILKIIRNYMQIEVNRNKP